MRLIALLMTVVVLLSASFIRSSGLSITQAYAIGIFGGIALTMAAVLWGTAIGERTEDYDEEARKHLCVHPGMYLEEDVWYCSICDEPIDEGVRLQ